MNGEIKIKLMSRWKIFAFAVSVLAIALFLLGRSRTPEDANACISINGEAVMEIRLSDAKDGVFSLRESQGIPVDFEIIGRRIRFINVECPDHICEKTGFVGIRGEAAVCMPNKTAVTIN